MLNSKNRIIFADISRKKEITENRRNFPLRLPRIPFLFPRESVLDRVLDTTYVTRRKDQRREQRRKQR